MKGIDKVIAALRAGKVQPATLSGTRANGAFQYTESVTGIKHTGTLKQIAALPTAKAGKKTIQRRLDLGWNMTDAVETPSRSATR